MSQPAKVPEEPSIDEILASIRRSIVPDDDTPGKPVARKPSSRKAGPAAAPVASPAETNGGNADGEVMQTDPEWDDGQGTHRAEPHPGLNGTHLPPKGESQVTEDGRWWDDDDKDGPARDQAEVTTAAIAFSGVPRTRANGLLAPDGSLLSPHTTAAVDTAFNSLTHTMLSQNPRTLEDLVRDMLKPMLKAWLDANLPDMVERLVRAEIERVSRRG